MNRHPREIMLLVQLFQEACSSFCFTEKRKEHQAPFVGYKHPVQRFHKTAHMVHTLSCTHTGVDYAQIVIAIGFLINSVHWNVEDSPARCVNIEFYIAFYLGNIVRIRGTALSHGESRIYGSGRETKPTLRLALVQLSVGDDKPVNVSRAATFIERAKQERADIVALPECFNSPYGTCNYPM
ncbi:Nitrilase-like protein 2 [Camponotus floridanus]|uniref:Nitrilase-like protein 2 n=1 Tax=Camponotus floridanus TaxID=104421 RepID=E2A5C2_CAMFO|nr:Nitrilase-like protein 2 [Camponotus floridanus]